MAKRMKSKIQPAVQTFTFKTDTVPAEGTSNFYVDLSQCASILNRRFYRQGLNWAVSSIKIISGGFTGAVMVNKLPNTWVMSNAWEKGFRAWQKQQKMALEENQSVKAKFNDFKIFADANHHSAGFGDNLLPVDGDVVEALPGEWEPSQIVIPNYSSVGVNYEPYIQAVGDDVAGAGGTISLIKAYEDSRSVPQSPDPALTPGVNSADNIYRMMFDVGDNMEDVLENASTNNDELPYDQLNYPGGDTNLPGLELHDYNTISVTTIGGETISKGGNFPCGLIKFFCQNNERTPHNLVFQINLVPGNHRGYLAESMTEM